ncbi:hypothetical protein MPSEU_000477900 [Mayamaea pseudoterrestris]|nr:hypothetical protein MPSEU_000477900 [Mayamaea pseudoterrestris]
MSRVDPRTKKKQGDDAMGATATAATTASILLSGDDEPMDIDEALPLLPAAAPLASAAFDNNISLHQEQKIVNLITPIKTPSPYPQHNSGPTSTRYKNALNRITLQPRRDVEAWQALLTEAQSCYRTILESAAATLSSHDAHQREIQLDWIESCYGYLLQTFPYAAQYQVRVAQLLWTQTARPGDDDYDLHVLMDDEQSWARRSLTVEHKHVPSLVSPQRAAQCELKLLHLLRHSLGYNLDGEVAAENANESHAVEMDDGGAEDDKPSPLGGVCVWSVELWLVYIFAVSRQARRQCLASTDDVDAQRIAVREATTRAFDLAVQNAGFAHNNHVLWKQYLAFVRSWTLTVDQNSGMQHVLAQQQMVQLRSVYQRAVVLPMVGLDLFWNEYEAFERTQSEALAQALTQDFAPKYQHARNVYLERNRVYGGSGDLHLDRLATDPVIDNEDDYAAKMEDEYKLLRIWKIRTSYQRTNPERLSSSESAQRIRHAYKEMICVMTRHPECWYQWGMWELSGAESKSPERAIAVLQLAQGHIPDSTLLAYAEAQIVELSACDSMECIDVMERLLARCPSTLGFVICQQLVRRYKGAEEARAVFARARRVLALNVASNAKGNVEEAATFKDDAAQEGGDGVANQSHNEVSEKQKWAITNRLDSSIGKEGLAKSVQFLEVMGRGEATSMASYRGVVTWHLYAAHATMEHRMNGAREVAGRTYELGLRKHGNFLTKAPYVLRYAQLLLELGDTTNLRALLRRAVAACEDQGKEGSLAALWDITLYFESLLDPDESSGARLDEIERKRRTAVLGPDIEDVATGGLLSSSDVPLIGAQKTSISEQLIRLDGYDVSSKIVNGLSRALDFLEVSGFLGSDGFTLALSRRRAKQEKDVDVSAGASDALYQKRAQFQSLINAGGEFEVPMGDSGATSKLLSARERFQQQATGLGAGHSTAMMLVIQQSPEWLRSLLVMLPASKLRVPIVPKPPPHLIEMALATLRLNSLPSERPAETIPKKRSLHGASGDSSDDEDDNRKGGGYGTAFRKRRTRLTPNGFLE